MKTFSNILKGERLTLRRLLPIKEHADMLLEVARRNRQDILSWMAFKESEIIPKDYEDSIRIIKDINEWEKKGRAVYYGIFLNDRFIGIVMADIFEKTNHAEPGPWIDSLFRGNGYAKEARLLLENELFSKGIEKIVTSVDYENIASINLIKSLGYKEDRFVKNSYFNKFRQQYRDELFFIKLNPNKNR